jgi:hypothetical protein
VSALKHGLFSSGFMLCDRCLSNLKCECFVPGSTCVLEQETFDKAVSEMVEEYDLDGVADKIMAERAAMYLIRIMRAEAYEATVGLNAKTAYWDIYIGKMDSMMMRLFNDLAISRGKRMKLEKGDALLVDFDEIMRKFGRLEQKSDQPNKQGIKMRRRGGLSVRGELLVMWEKDYAKIRTTLKRGEKVGGEKTETS